MYAFEGSAIENKKGRYKAVKELFDEEGFELGGGWEIDHGYFDKKLDDHPGYLYLRIPVFAEEGQIEEPEARVRMGRPFVLRHKYQIGNDDYVDTDVGVVFTNTWFNQFSEPEDSDASLKEDDVQRAQKALGKLEQAFQDRFPQ